MARLDESIEDVIDTVVAAVLAKTAVNESLDGVKSVVRGDRARPMPELPAVWIVPQPARMIRETYEDETWSLPLSLAALVKGDTPADAGRESQRITALARSAALQAKAAAEAAGAAVTDIVSTSFDPTARSSERNRNLFWTEAVVTVTFTVTE